MNFKIINFLFLLFFAVLLSTFLLPVEKIFANSYNATTNFEGNTITTQISTTGSTIDSGSLSVSGAGGNGLLTISPQGNGTYIVTGTGNFGTFTNKNLPQANILGLSLNNPVSGGRYCPGVATAVSGLTSSSACSNMSGDSIPLFAFVGNTYAGVVGANAVNGTWSQNLTIPDIPGNTNLNLVFMTSWGIKGFVGPSSIDSGLLSTPIYIKNNASCGSARGGTYISAPTSGLCGTDSTASPVSGSGSTWSWTCTGCGSVPCTATRNVTVNGKCGSAKGGTFSSAPTSGLCNPGTATVVSNVGSTWSWTCTGSGTGHTNEPCTANKKVDGGCGSAEGGYYSTPPTSGLCDSNSTAGPVTNKIVEYTWKCYGKNGGAAADCFAYHFDAGACGDINGGSASTFPTLASSYCNSFSTPSAISWDGTEWSWNCKDSRGNWVGPCIFYYSQPGVCNVNTENLKYTSAPTANLCTQGTPSAVTKVDLSSNNFWPPYLWIWTCAGTGYNAPAAGCYAYPPSVAGSCGSANRVATTWPTTNLCSTGTPSTVLPCTSYYYDDTGATNWCNGNGPYWWACIGDQGGSNTTFCTAPVNGQCGSTNNTKLGTNAPPVYNLCDSGLASAVSGNNPWYWTCLGSPGGNNSLQCSASYSSATCGSASSSVSNQGTVIAPTTNLCGTGSTAGTVTWSDFGNDWQWFCYGPQGMTYAFCYDVYEPPTVCGTANHVAVNKAPTQNLCSSTDTPSAVSGGATGPWSWTCTNPNYTAGVVSCSAPYTEKGVCGSSSGISGTTIPTSGLCSVGSITNAFGGSISAPMSEPKGWYWYCSTGGDVSSMCEYVNSTLGYASCGSYSGTYTTTNVAPACNSSSDCTNLCATGTFGTITRNDVFHNWTWKCLGSTTAKNTSCYAFLIVSGACGEASRTFQQGEGWSSDMAYCSIGSSCPFGSTCPPLQNLTVLGTAGGSITQWRCNGINGGQDSAICTATRATDGACGSANKSYSQNATSFGTDTFCSPGNAVDASTGTAITPSFPTAGNQTQWKCTSTNGGATSATCTASHQSNMVNGACGTNSGKYFSSAPTTNLCLTTFGNTPVKDSNNVDNGPTGPWSWSCNGGGTGTSAPCSAQVLPTVGSLTKTEQDCGYAPGASLINLNWASTGQSDYSLQITHYYNNDGSADFTDSSTHPLDYDLQSQSASKSIAFRVLSALSGSDVLLFNTKYSWRIKVSDGQGHYSGWAQGTPFTTPLHAFPTASIKFTPPSPLVNQLVCLSASTSDPSSEYIYDFPSYSWTFDDKTISTLATPTCRKYNSSGSYKETLKVCDNENECCTVERNIPVRSAQNLPQWREVSPF